MGGFWGRLGVMWGLTDADHAWQAWLAAAWVLLGVVGGVFWGWGRAGWAFWFVVAAAVGVYWNYLDAGEFEKKWGHPPR